jgi:predicted Zn-dependent protease
VIAARTLPSLQLHLYAVVVLLAIGRFSDPAAAAPIPAALAHPFRAQDWDLAWQAFIGAGEVGDAYTLAQRAVRAQPRSRLWLARLAQAARWSNHPRTALEALCRLALDLHEARYLQPAFDLAVGLGDDDQAVTLLREIIRLGRATPAQRSMLSGLYLNIGEPDRAIVALQQEFARDPVPQVLWEQAVIYGALGEPKRELAALVRYRERFGPGPQVMLAIATLEYVQGRLPQALDALLEAQPRARRSDTAYWETLSGLAWLLGRYPLAGQAAQVLIDTGKADTADYQRVVYADQYRHPRRAFSFAERGWNQTHDPSLFMSMLDIAASLQPATPWLARAFAALAPGQAAAFAAQPAYWTSLAELRSGQGRNGEALAAYRHALRLRPGDDSLLAGYLWLLIDSGHLTPIAPNLYRLARRANRAPALWAPVAAVYAALEQPERALPWLQAQWSARRNDPLWLMDYADTLEQADRPEAAWQLRRRAYDLLARDAASRPEGRRSERPLRALSALATSLAPGDPARRAIESLARKPASQEARVTVLAWMLSEQAYPLARWWELRAFLRQPPPDWAQLAQAVGTKDNAAIARLLGRRHVRLPRRDRVAAATDLGRNSWALTAAYQGLEGEPEDARLQRQFDDLAVARADNLEATTAATRWSGLLAAGASLQGSQWLGAADRLDIRIDTTRQRVIDSTQLGSVPSLSRSALLVWQQATNRGSLTFDLGAGRNLTGWSREGITWQRRWPDGFATSFGATAGARPLDTAALSVAGLEDRLDAGASARPTARSSLQVQLQAGWLRAQGGGSLGLAQRFSLDGDYQLRLSPPDLTLHASLSGAHYARAAHLPEQLLPLEPSGRIAPTDFFVPDSFVQVCGGSHFNMQYAAAFTGRLRPYADAELCANSVSGEGYDLTAGAAMPLFGSDHLSLRVDLESNVGTHSGRTAGAMLSYHRYFTPTH